jgi:hypothetical protein
MDYALPRAGDLPFIGSELDESQPWLRRSRCDRRAGRDRQRGARCAQPARHHRHRYAADAGSRLARDCGGEYSARVHSRSVSSWRMIRSSGDWELGSQACRHLAAPPACRWQPQVRFQGEADTNRPVRPVGSVDNDPSRTLIIFLNAPRSLFNLGAAPTKADCSRQPLTDGQPPLSSPRKASCPGIRFTTL